MRYLTIYAGMLLLGVVCDVPAQDQPFRSSDRMPAATQSSDDKELCKTPQALRDWTQGALKELAISTQVKYGPGPNVDALSFLVRHLGSSNDAVSREAADLLAGIGVPIRVRASLFSNFLKSDRPLWVRNIALAWSVAGCREENHPEFWKQMAPVWKTTFKDVVAGPVAPPHAWKVAACMGQSMLVGSAEIAVKGLMEGSDQELIARRFLYSLKAAPISSREDVLRTVLALDPKQAYALRRDAWANLCWLGA